MSTRDRWGFGLAVVTIVPIAQAMAIFSLGADSNWAGAAFTVALVAAGLFAALTRVTSLTPGAAVGGYLVAAALTVPWGIGLFVLSVYVGCNVNNQCFS